jgi:hypothetical protein
VTFAIHGIDGVLALLAVLLFLVAAIIAWFVTPRSYWPSFVALGLCLWALTLIVH